MSNIIRMSTNKTYREWFKKIVWLQDKIILPNNIRISKSNYITKNGFEIDSFNTLLFKIYNKLYPVNDGRRYKK